MTHKRRKLTLKQQGLCHWCQDKMLHFDGLVTLKSATIDHLMPVSKGGNDNHCNLVVACSACNFDRGDRTPEETPEWLEKRKAMIVYCPKCSAHVHVHCIGTPPRTTLNQEDGKFYRQCRTCDDVEFDALIMQGKIGAAMQITRERYGCDRRTAKKYIEARAGDLYKKHDIHTHSEG